MISGNLLKEFYKKNVLITGGSGLIGRQVVEQLVDAQACIRSVSLDNIIVNEKAENIVGDLMNMEFCKEIVRDMDYIFHIAGIQGTVQTSSTGIASHFVPTLMMNTNLLEAARLNGIKKLIYTSSIGAYEDREILKESDYKLESSPMSFAGWAKRMAELQIYAYKKQYGIKTYSIVRLSNIYGPGDNFDPATAMVIPALMYRIYRGDNPLVVWGDGKVVRDFLYSRDASEGIILAFLYGTEGEFVNIASGKGHSIREVVDIMHSFIDFDYNFDTSKPSGAPMRVMDISKAKEMFGFSPSIELSEGLRLTWEWFIKNPEEHKNKLNYFIDESK